MKHVQSQYEDPVLVFDSFVVRNTTVEVLVVVFRDMVDGLLVVKYQDYKDREVDRAVRISRFSLVRHLRRDLFVGFRVDGI